MTSPHVTPTVESEALINTVQGNERETRRIESIRGHVAGSRLPFDQERYEGSEERRHWAEEKSIFQ